MWNRRKLRILCFVWIVGLILAAPMHAQTGVNNAELKGDYAFTFSGLTTGGGNGSTPFASVPMRTNGSTTSVAEHGSRCLERMEDREKRLFRDFFSRSAHTLFRCCGRRLFANWICRGMGWRFCRLMARLRRCRAAIIYGG